ncbi:MAG: sigma-54 dependent transcriptional regulator [Thermodesulfobacteriota bacterium]
MTASPILIVDDEESILFGLRALILSLGLPEPVTLTDPTRVMGLVKNNDFHLVLLDLIMPGLNGMELLKIIKHEHPEIECIVITGVDEVPTAVEAMKYGAYDYLVKPINMEKLAIGLEHALERYALRQRASILDAKPSFSDLKNPAAFSAIITADEAMSPVLHLAETVAATDYNVLLTGESGTGKELLARVIHALSFRAARPFLAVNLAALSHDLFEDDLFGHAKGAFTGALSERKGFFQAAAGGTFFLDEITELDQNQQARLLRVIQEKEYFRLGSARAENVDLRLISATNRDILENVRQGVFRLDLYHRLNTFRIHIPPLRQRRGDILPLAHFFLQRHAARNKKAIQRLSSEMKAFLLEYSFPGNVRELENIIASAVLMEKGSRLSLSSIAEWAPFLVPWSTGVQDDYCTLSALEASHIKRVLESTAGNRTKAAAILGVERRTLQRKLKALGLPSKQPRGRTG